MRKESPFDQAMHFLTGLFHSKMFEGESEQERECPFCEKRLDEEMDEPMWYSSKRKRYEPLENHIDVALHILEEHPDKLFRYTESIDGMLENPIGNIESSLNGWLKLLIDEDRLPDFENQCAICGFNPQFRGKLELRQHFEKEHREQLKQIRDIMDNMQKQV